MVAVAGGSACVYGMSSGAVLALRAAAAGVGVRRLGLFEPPFMPGGIPANYLPRLTAALAGGQRAEALRLFMVELVGIPAEVAAGTTRRPELQALAHTLVYDHAVMTGDIPTGVEVPTLALAGGDSPRWMRDAARSVGGYFRVLDGQTHNVDPAVLATALGEYFD
jgi:hypothetical protein